jgi:hypothetical protein
VANGGARPGAGRKKGGANRITQEAIAKAANGLSPLDYMLAVLRDDGNELTTRLDAAKAAAPYCHAKRAPVDGEGKEVSLTVIIQKPGA